MFMEQELEFGNKVDGAVYRERPGVYGLIINNDNKIAVIRTKNGYFLPGGGLEGNETHQECLKRECTEEMGYDIEIGEYLGKASDYIISFKAGEYLKVIGNFYIARLLEPNYLKTEEDHELVWLIPEEAIDRMHTEFQAWAIKQFMLLIKRGD